jgi:regulator of RNase E activity RraA
MTTAAVMRGGTGAVIDGMIRDVKKILTMNFPVFCVGMKPLDSKGRGLVMDFDCPIECGDVPVQPGDIVFGDYDGLVVVPQEVEAEVWARAVEKVEGENVTRAELLQGALLSEVYARYGVL